MEVFQDYAYYYNSFYNDKNYYEEANKIKTIIDRYDSSVKSIINFGCGTGKHDIELLKMGYMMHGIDMSEGMIDIAKKNVAALGLVEEFEVADIREYYATKKYDAVSSLFHVMSYQTTNEDISRAFSSARKCLRKGGLFIFDVWYGPGVLTDLPTIRVKKTENEDHFLVRIARPVLYDKSNIVNVNYEVLVTNKKDSTTKVINEIHSMRYYFRPELELLLNSAGFILLDNMDCNSLEETDFSSWTSYFVARAV